MPLSRPSLHQRPWAGGDVRNCHRLLRLRHHHAARCTPLGSERPPRNRRWLQRAERAGLADSGLARWGAAGCSSRCSAGTGFDRVGPALGALGFFGQQHPASTSQHPAFSVDKNRNQAAGILDLIQTASKHRASNLQRAGLHATVCRRGSRIGDRGPADRGSRQSCIGQGYLPASLGYTVF